MTFWYEPDPDPHLWLTDPAPDPALFVSGKFGTLGKRTQTSNTATRNSLRPPVARVKSLESSKMSVRCTVSKLIGRFPNVRQVTVSIMDTIPPPPPRTEDNRQCIPAPCLPGSITTRHPAIPPLAQHEITIGQSRRNYSSGISSGMIFSRRNNEV